LLDFIKFTGKSYNYDVSSRYGYDIRIVNACPPIRIPILVYHAHIFSGRDYAGNGHIALAADLETIAAAGRRVVPLRWIVEWLLGERGDGDLQGAVGLSFDDGTILDFQAVDHPLYGRLPGFLPILEAFRACRGGEQPDLNATCFVIASPLAREEMDRACLYGAGWLASNGWAAAAAGGLLEIGNHSWDHNHEAASEAPGVPRGTFRCIDTERLADHEIRRAQMLIGQQCGTTPCLFAYPYGESNDYLEGEYLPRHGPAIGLAGAFTTGAAPVTKQTSRWSIPRYVHGRDWRSAQELVDLLRATV